MSISQIEIQLIAVVTAAACAVPGVFLVLRRRAMLTDAISHTVLLGIVIGFFIFEDLASPFLILGAAAVGVLTVSLVSLIERTRLLKEDAAIGLVFPALFSIAVILISTYAGNVHLDIDVVLIGEIAFAPFDRLYLFGMDAGPRGLYVMGVILLVNAVFILLFYKELKITTFDEGLAASLGFVPSLLHYGLMSMVSVTVVGAFDIVGSVLVVALVVAPPVTAYLLTDRLSAMFGLSILFGILGALGGYWMANLLEASISGSIAAMSGFIFAVVFLFAPDRGMLALAQRRTRQRIEFAVTMLTGHLLNHEGSQNEPYENCTEHLHEHIRWAPEFAQKIVTRAKSLGLIEVDDCLMKLTPSGRQRATSQFMEKT
jgi:manganese/zinc/iron transport system permease protein